MVEHAYFDTLEAATAGAIVAGVDAAYENVNGIQAALRAGLADGTLPRAQLDRAVQRLLLTRFRLGEFDSNNPANPFRGPYDVSELDGVVHRKIARDAAAASLVLLENRANVLPLTTLPPQLAVMGSFSNCRIVQGDYGGHDRDAAPDQCGAYTCSYGHSYSGSTSSVSTYLSAAQDEAGNSSKVQWVQGSQAHTICGSDGVTAAVALARASGLVIFVAGLGSEIEVEGTDRTSLELPVAQAELLANVSAAVGANRIVLLLVSGGPVDVDPALASTILWTGYPGEEAGHALMDVIMGRIAPSGRMPLTVYTNAYLGLVGPVADFNMVSHGVGRTYKYYLNATQRGLAPQPRYWFGYGLSFGAFQYKSPTAVQTADGSVQVDVDVSYTGTHWPAVQTIREVIQVYVTVPQVQGLLTAPYKLCAAVVRTLSQGAAPPTIHVTAAVPLTELYTYADDGTRNITKGTYTFWISGHAPFDALGIARASNVVNVSVALG